MSSIERMKGKRRWRHSWRDGGRGSKQRHSEWVDDRRLALAEKEKHEERQLATRSTRGRLVIPWKEVRAKWIATLSGRYAIESKRALENHTAHWLITDDATPAAMSKLPIGPMRAARACVRWAWLILDQPMDLRAMKVEPVRVRAKKRKPDLTDDDHVMAYIEKATSWSPGNGAICHLIALYAPRAESLVRLTGDAFDGTSLTYKNKNGEIETQQLAPWSIAIINALEPKPGMPLFRNHLGVPWKSGQAFSCWFHHNIGEGTGWKTLLRCTSMTRMLELAGDAKTASSVSKHKTPSLIPNTYALTNNAKELELVGKIAGRLSAFSGPRLVNDT